MNVSFEAVFSNSGYCSTVAH